jgi:hypothetical protein
MGYFLASTGFTWSARQELLNTVNNTISYILCCPWKFQSKYSTFAQRQLNHKGGNILNFSQTSYGICLETQELCKRLRRRQVFF